MGSPTLPPMPRPSSQGVLPTDAAARKEIPLATGCYDYFPDALMGVARVSFKGNIQHNPGQPLHWAKEKSRDHSDTMQRHFVERFDVDVDGEDHAAKMCWRALAFYQTLLEERRSKEVADVKPIRKNVVKPSKRKQRKT